MNKIGALVEEIEATLAQEKKSYADGDESDEKAQFDGCDRRSDGLIHRTRCSNLHMAQTMVRSLALKP